MAKRDWSKARPKRHQSKPKPSLPGRRAATAIGAYDNYFSMKRRIREENDRLLARDTDQTNG